LLLSLAVAAATVGVGVAAVAVASKSNGRVGVNHANEYVGADAQALQDF